MVSHTQQTQSLNIVQLELQEYKGFTLVFRYETDDYYEITRTPGEFFTIRLDRKAFTETQKKGFDGHLFDDHLGAPSAFALYSGDQVAGYIEVDRETWHERLRVTELLILEPYRRKGFGRILMDKAKTIAEGEGFREIVLETQSCNTRAIDFYIQQEFFVNGIDLSHYTNTDVEKHEVRIEMVYRCEGISNGIN
jgi:ribosomal protein S18 acetylase RimI-like enzyme